MLKELSFLKPMLIKAFYALFQCPIEDNVTINSDAFDMAVLLLRSLFRTDSEECGIRDLSSVRGPVNSYSLFDTMWSANLQNASPGERKN